MQYFHWSDVSLFSLKPTLN